MYRILFYSGNADGCVPTLGSEAWIRELKWAVKEEYRTWYTDGQVAGWIEEFDGLTFAVVNGAGHLVPQWKRAQAHHLITNWIKKTPV